MSLQLVIPQRVALQQRSPPLHQLSVILKEKRNFEKEKLLNCMCTNSELSQQRGSPHTLDNSVTVHIKSMSNVTYLFTVTTQKGASW
jgi:hypothetical protein